MRKKMRPRSFKSTVKFIPKISSFLKIQEIFEKYVIKIENVFWVLKYIYIYIKEGGN